MQCKRKIEIIEIDTLITQRKEKHKNREENVYKKTKLATIFYYCFTLAKNEGHFIIKCFQ